MSYPDEGVALLGVDEGFLFLRNNAVGVEKVLLQIYIVVWNVCIVQFKVQLLLMGLGISLLLVLILQLLQITVVLDLLPLLGVFFKESQHHCVGLCPYPPLAIVFQRIEKCHQVVLNILVCHKVL